MALENRSVEPFAVWIDLSRRDELNSSARSNRVLPPSGLCWVRRVLASRIPLVVESLTTVREKPDEFRANSRNDDSGFHRVLPLPWAHQDVAYPWPPSQILVGTSSRNDPIDEAVEALRERYPEIPVRLVLDEWWAGHRRTQPIVAGTDRSYWFQLFDEILPSVLAIGEFRNNVEASTSSLTGKELETPTLLVVSDHADNRQLWLDVMAECGWSVNAIRDASHLPEGRYDFIFVDPFDTPKTAEIARLRKVYPRAKLTAFFSFPRWETASACLEAGADVILGKPFQLEGLLRSFSSAALPLR